MSHADLPITIDLKQTHVQLPILIPRRTSGVGGVVQAEVLSILNMKLIR